MDVVLLTTCCTMGYLQWAPLRQLLEQKGIKTSFKLVQRTNDVGEYLDMCVIHSLPDWGEPMLVINGHVKVPCSDLSGTERISEWAARLEEEDKRHGPV